MFYGDRLVYFFVKLTSVDSLFPMKCINGFPWYVYFSLQTWHIQKSKVWVYEKYMKWCYNRLRKCLP